MARRPPSPAPRCNNSELVGVNFYNQAFVFDAKANLAGATLSNAITARIGRRVGGSTPDFRRNRIHPGSVNRCPHPPEDWINPPKAGYLSPVEFEARFHERAAMMAA